MSGDAATLIGLWAIAYLIGAVPASYLLAKVSGGIDLRRHGSGNVGGSNLASQLGKRWLLPVAAIDLCRGAVPILLGQHALGLDGMLWWLMGTPLFTMLGNNWSPFLRFSGGRSVGLWAGALLGMSPPFFLGALLVYLLGWWAMRRSAEWLVVVMALLPPVAAAWPDRWMLTVSPEQMAGFSATAAVIILLKRLTANGEPLPVGVSRNTVILNRLLRDRDIADRKQWLSRVADHQNNIG